ncbi:MAG: chemotaxis protein CheA [Reichenbachiella sp.]
MNLSLTPQEEKELMEMFSFEAQEIHAQINEFLTSLEASPDNKELIDDLFRVTHTLKGSAMGMGFKQMAEIGHVMEDVFGEIKEGTLEMDKSLFNNLFTASDKLGQLVTNITEKKKISHKGIKTKLEVIIRKAKGLTDLEDLQDNTELEVIIESPSEVITNEMPASEEEQEEPHIATASDIHSHEGVFIFNDSEEDAVKEEEVLDEEDVFASKKISDDIYSSHSDVKHGALYKIKEFFTQLFSSTSPKEQSIIESVITDDIPVEEEVENDVEEVTSGAFVFDDDSEIDIDTDVSIQDTRPTLTTNDEESVHMMLESIDSDDGSGDDAEQNEDFLSTLQDKASVTDLVQVPIRKLDNLMNQVGQLIIERDRLMAQNSTKGSRNAEFASLQRITSDLQYSVMDVRLVQIGSLFNKFHRIARDVASIENKNVGLVVKGVEVEIDRNILKIMSDSMVHLVRNAVGHGIESTEERALAGKSEEAVITLSARNEKDNVIIEVSDDGKGIDADVIREKIIDKGIAEKEYVDQLSDNEVIMYIFETGFSGASQVSEVSGRGVGMDVVKKSTESIGGQVSVKTVVGVGTTVSLRLPASMAVKGVLMFQMSHQEYAFALSYTEAVISLKKGEIHKAGVGLMTSYLKKTISVVFFSDLLRMNDFSEVFVPGAFHDTFDSLTNNTKLDVIIITYGDKFIGVVVDKLLQQKEIIEKPIPKPLDNNVLMSGTTILGNGNVCMVADVAAITGILYRSKMKVQDKLSAS